MTDIDTPGFGAAAFSAQWLRDNAGSAPPPLPAPILRSWLRCADLGLDRDARPRAEPLPNHALRQAVERNEMLRQRCRPGLEALYSTTRSTDSIVILTDGEGLVLDAIGSPGFVDRAAQVALRPGVSWAESATGTNAIGSALVERRAVEVRGPEHFFTRNRILSCAAVPILDPTGQLLGVLDLSGNAKADHRHALGLVQLAVDGIEHRGFERAFPGCEVVRLHSDAALLGTPREGILVFRDHVLVAANRHGLRLANLDWDMLGQRTYRTLFPSQQAVGADTILLRDADGRIIHARRPSSNGQASPLAPVRAPAGPHTSVAIAKPPASGAMPLFDASTRARLARAVRLLDAGVPLLIQGETGTGKEVFARAAHAASTRGARPFVAINCTALPESLIESELFGYEAGAFTGARRGGAKGLLREADGGLLFLDEIGDMPLALQPRLLRALQEREVVPVGAVKGVPIDITLVCASHRDLAQRVAEGSFRADLYFRVAAYTVDLPALRSLEDRAAIVRAIWSSLDPMTRGVTLTAACETALSAYAWPGNFRQLVGSLKAMLALAETGEALDIDALAANIRQGSPIEATSRRDDPDNLDRIEHTAVQDALKATNGNVTKAAHRLGISRSTLYRRYLSGGTLE